MKTNRLFDCALIVLAVFAFAGCATSTPTVHNQPTVPVAEIFVEKPAYYEDFVEIDGRLSPVKPTNGDNAFSEFLRTTFQEALDRTGLKTVPSDSSQALRLKISLVHSPWMPIVHQREKYLIQVYEDNKILVDYSSLFRFALIGPWVKGGSIGDWTTKKEVEDVVRLIVERLRQKTAASAAR